MAKLRTPRLPAEIRQLLDGCDWHWYNGKKHWQLIVNGCLAGTWSHGKPPDRWPRTASAISAIRRLRDQQPKED